MSISVFNLGDANFSSSSPLNDSKVNHRHRMQLSQTGTVVAAKQYFGPIRANSSLIMSVKAAITEAIATGGDRTVTIDAQRSTGGGAFSSVLTSTLVLNNASTPYVPVQATINSNTLSAGDLLMISVTVAGVAGNQALGLCVSVEIAEPPS